MSSKCKGSLAGMVCLALLFLSSITIASDKPIVINDDAGWCWFQDERAIFHGNTLIAGSVASGFLDPARKGNIEVVSLDLSSGKRGRFVLHRKLELDDHNAPALLLLPDERILAIYSKHGTDRKIRCRTTTHPGNIESWTPEQFYKIRTWSRGVTYSNVYRLKAEAGRIYNFHRGRYFDPNLVISEDDGNSWEYVGRLIQGPGRPYVRYASNNVDSVHFVATDQHPSNFDNSLFHGYVKDGAVFDSYGNQQAELSQAAVTHDQLTKIFQSDPDNVAWISDVDLDEQGRVYAVYSVQKDGAGKPVGTGGLDHRYRYAMFDGESWHDHEIGYAGSRLYPGQDDYTGLVCLDPQSLDTVYFSADVSPKTGEPLISSVDGERHYEIFKGVTPDNGRSWEITPVTQNSEKDNIRPHVPMGGPPGSALIWLRGKMKTYTNYELEMVVLHPAP